MKIYQLSIFKLIGFALLVSTLSTGCQQGAPARKKMPGYITDEGFEANYSFKTKKDFDRKEAFMFTTENIELSTNGNSHACVSVALPDASLDTKAIELLETYKPFAPILLGEWAKQNRNGVLIDLRSNTLQTAMRADYVLETSPTQSFPVIIMWEAQGAHRANYVINAISSIPGINAKKVGQ